MDSMHGFNHTFPQMGIRSQPDWTITCCVSLYLLCLPDDKSPHPDWGDKYEGHRGQTEIYAETAGGN